MKKLLLATFFAFALSNVSFAYIGDETTADLDVLERQGYSQSTLELVDLTNSLHADEGKHYQRQFVKKTPSTALGRGYQRVKVYFDPMQDDGVFGEHKIEYANTWNSDEVPYASAKKRVRRAENL